MPRRIRPLDVERSERWLRTAVNDYPDALNSLMSEKFGWEKQEKIEWLSPIISDDYAEYYDKEFLDRLEVSKLKVPLSEFWPPGGPRWDGLGKTRSGKIILVEAKAYIEEGVDYVSRAGPKSSIKIREALAEAKKAFAAAADAPWESPFYQYANRLAHLYFAHQLNGLDAYLLFLYFADAPDVPRPPNPCTVEQWQGAIRLTEKCLGLDSKHFRDRFGTVIWRVPDMLSSERSHQTPEIGRLTIRGGSTIAMSEGDFMEKGEGQKGEWSDADRLQALARYLPIFTALGFKFGEFVPPKEKDGVTQFGWFDLGP